MLQGLTHHIGHQVSVKVWRDHDIKLVRPGHKLHACVVHNHLLSLHTKRAIGIYRKTQEMGIGINMRAVKPIF